MPPVENHKIRSGTYFGVEYNCWQLVVVVFYSCFSFPPTFLVLVICCDLLNHKSQTIISLAVKSYYSEVCSKKRNEALRVNWSLINGCVANNPILSSYEQLTHQELPRHEGKPVLSWLHPHRDRKALITSRHVHAKKKPLSCSWRLSPCTWRYSLTSF